MKPIYTDVLFAGGGAASFFAAINLKTMCPGIKIIILERGKNFLEKVRISGGGRCNVTNEISDPKTLAINYPRGSKNLIGPFTRFSSSDTKNWFHAAGVPLKTESDGRVFPLSDSSESIIACFMQKIKRGNIDLLTGESIVSFTKQEDKLWTITTSKNTYKSKLLFLGTGSNNRVWDMLKNMDVNIIPPVPSLFTFNIKHPLIKDLMGIDFKSASVRLLNSKLKTEGPVLITHWGLSGPAVLKMSAWGARELADLNYQFEIEIDWLVEIDAEEMLKELHSYKSLNAKKHVHSTSLFSVPLRFWKSMVQCAEIADETKWADLSKIQMQAILRILKSSRFNVNGKSTFKEEFVTAGGVDLKEVDFKHFRLKKIPELYLAGEVLDIDGITGGFNFQAAWTGAWIAANSMSEFLKNDQE